MNYEHVRTVDYNADAEWLLAVLGDHDRVSNMLRKRFLLMNNVQYKRRDLRGWPVVRYLDAQRNVVAEWDDECLRGVLPK
jgi:hypothetical protein